MPEIPSHLVGVIVPVVYLSDNVISHKIPEERYLRILSSIKETWGTGSKGHYSETRYYQGDRIYAVRPDGDRLARSRVDRILDINEGLSMIFYTHEELPTFLFTPQQGVDRISLVEIREFQLDGGRILFEKIIDSYSFRLIVTDPTKLDSHLPKLLSVLS